MTTDSQGVLTEALTQLQSELEQFDGMQKALKGAKQRLDEAEKEWASLTQEQQLTAAELIKATKDAIEATKAVTGQASVLTAALLPLAKAVENVDFPRRLDKIDMAVATQSSALMSFQATADRRFDVLDAIHARVGRFGWFSVVLLMLNSAGLIAVLIHNFWAR
jgi:DNA repair exonuclease SbcCD ATPase subunit